jgi:hypothetical protein
MFIDRPKLNRDLGWYEREFGVSSGDEPVERTAFRIDRSCYWSFSSVDPEATEVVNKFGERQLGKLLAEVDAKNLEEDQKRLRDRAVTLLGATRKENGSQVCKSISKVFSQIDSLNTLYLSIYDEDGKLNPAFIGKLCAVGSSEPAKVGRKLTPEELQKRRDSIAAKKKAKEDERKRVLARQKQREKEAELALAVSIENEGRYTDAVREAVNCHMLGIPANFPKYPDFHVLQPRAMEIQKRIGPLTREVFGVVLTGADDFVSEQNKINFARACIRSLRNQTAPPDYEEFGVHSDAATLIVSRCQDAITLAST